FSGLRRSIWSVPRKGPAGAWVAALAWTAALGVALLFGALALHREYEGLAFGFLAVSPQRFAAWLGQKALEAGGPPLALQGFLPPRALSAPGRAGAPRVGGGPHFGGPPPAEPDAGRRDRDVGPGLGRAVPPPRLHRTAYRFAHAAFDAGLCGDSRSTELAAE